MKVGRVENFLRRVGYYQPVRVKQNGIEYGVYRSGWNVPLLRKEIGVYAGVERHPGPLEPSVQVAAESNPQVAVQNKDRDRIVSRIDQFLQSEIKHGAASEKFLQTNFKWVRSLLVSAPIAGVATVAFPFLGAAGLPLSFPAWAPFAISFLEVFAVALGIRGLFYWKTKSDVGKEYNLQVKENRHNADLIRELFGNQMHKEILASVLREKSDKDRSTIMLLFDTEKRKELSKIMQPPAPEVQPPGPPAPPARVEAASPPSAAEPSAPPTAPPIEISVSKDALLKGNQGTYRKRTQIAEGGMAITYDGFWEEKQIKVCIFSLKHCL